MEKKTIILALMTVCFISMALAYYPGEVVIFDNIIGTENLVYTIVGNSTPIGELNISINATNITVTFPGDMPVDNFDIIFFEPIEVEIIVEVEKRVEVEVEVESDPLIKYEDREVYVKQDPEIVTEFIEIEKIVNQTVALEGTGINSKGYSLLHIIVAILATMTIVVVIMMFLTRKKRNKNRENKDFVADPFRGVKK